MAIIMYGAGAVGGALGARLADAGHDVTSEHDDRARRGDLLQMHDLAGRERGGGSSWQSLRASCSTDSDLGRGTLTPPLSRSDQT